MAISQELENDKRNGMEYLRKRLLKMDTVFFKPDVSPNKDFEWFKGTSNDVILALDQEGHFDKLIEIPGYDVGNLESYSVQEYPNPYSEKERLRVGAQRFMMKSKKIEHDIYHDTKYTYLSVVRTDEETFYWRVGTSMIAG